MLYANIFLAFFLLWKILLKINIVQVIFSEQKIENNVFVYKRD